ncbi:onanonoxo-7-onima-8-eninoihtemlysoneda [Dentipellis sp. KUC8613]|nr:onanonoxo-7-onima-8-eninoihtemlysoneda [Dentipellis sp. KUC8613]
MSLLFKNLRIHQVFGANTDVGKTILTSALVRASAAAQNKVFYLKPVSTGPMEDADDEHVVRFSGSHRDRVQAHCLYRFDEPLSPQFAAQMSAEKNGADAVVIPSDKTFITSVASHIQNCASQVRTPAHMYVETAGGVHSPTLSGTTQLDSYRPLFLPTILIGDSKLGGISSTISSFEALQLRGYIVDSVLIFKDDYYRNWEYLTSYFAERGISVTAFDPPPPREKDYQKNFDLTEKYYQTLVPETREGGLFSVLHQLDERHAQRLTELESMPQRTLDTVWWPFVQHGLAKTPKDVNVIDSASGDFFSVFNGHKTSTSSRTHTTQSLLEPQFDGSASWWTQTLGHAHPALTLAAARAAGRYGHVMFPEATHLPALRLAERLVKDGPGKGWAARAFISDNGATGMEVALKMALRASAARAGLARADAKRLGVLGLKGSYHGDTIGAMDACEEGVYTCEWHSARGHWLDPPTVAVRGGRPAVVVPAAVAAAQPGAPAEETVVHADALARVYDVQNRLQSSLAVLYRRYIEQALARLAERGERFGALVLEPLLMGAGGMVFVDPLFQRVLIDVVRGVPAGSSSSSSSSSPAAKDWSGMPVIFDEVFVGLYRLGMQSTAPLLGVTPDISVNAKILTGGLLPLAVTLASDAVFQAFWSGNKSDALLHGHSYTAHAVGCEVANETLGLVEKVAGSEQWEEARGRWRALEEGRERKEGFEEREKEVFSLWDPGFVDAVSKLEAVGEVMTLGTVLAIKIAGDEAGYTSHSAQELLKSLRTASSDASGLSPAPGGAPYSVHYRTLGNVAYFMTSLNTSSETLRSMEDKIWEVLARGEVQ